MFRKLLSIGLLLALGSIEAQAADARAEAVAPFLDADVVMVARINIDSFDVEKLTGRLVEDQASAAMFTNGFAPWLAALRKAGARDLYLLGRLENLPAPGAAPPSAVVTLTRTGDADAVGKLLRGGREARAPFAWTASARIHGAVFAGSDEAVRRASRMKPVARPELAEALAAAMDSAAEAVVMPSADARRVFEEMMPNLPAEFGGGPVTTLTRDLRWGALTIQDQPEPALRLVLQARDASAAKSVAQIGGSLDRTLRISLDIKGAAPDFAKLSDWFTTAVDGDRITVSADAKAAGAWASAVLRPMRQGMTRADCANNLKQIGLAMHNYLDAHGTFPPAFVADEEGKPLLSWRVLILPYLDQNELYKEFHLDEPWDGPHNKALIGRMPKAYACPSELGQPLEPGRTTYAVPRGPRTIFPGAVGLKIKEITDGTSNTILTIDLPDEQAVTWTKPDDWKAPATIDPKAVLTRHQKGSNTGFADGSVHFLKEAISPQTLHDLTTRNGGEVISFDDL